MYFVPRPNLPFLDQYGNVNQEWYDYLAQLLGSDNNTDFQRQIDYLAAQIKALQDAQSTAGVIQGLGSILVTGSLADGIARVQLQNDDAAPGATYYYGTDADGNKGFFPIPESDGLPYPVLTDQLGNILTDQLGNILTGNTPSIPVAWVEGSPFLQDVIAGGNVTIDKTNPLKPIISAAGSGGGGGSVLSVAIAGTDGIEVDSGSPITTSGTITLGLSSATLNGIGLGTSSVQPARAISSGTGLTGGGDLSADRTLSLDSGSVASLAKADSAVQPTRQILTTGGIQGGGYLSADLIVSLNSATQASLAKADSAIQAADLGTAAYTPATNYATSSQGAKADSAVQPARQIATGTGLTGGGDLSADRTVALNSASIASLAKADTAVQPARSIATATALTGGGDLSANRTIDLSTATKASLTKADSALQSADLAPYQTKVYTTYPIGSLPAVTPYPQIIFVSGSSEVSSGIVPAYSDGTNWLRFTDNTPVS